MKREKRKLFGFTMAARISRGICFYEIRIRIMAQLSVAENAQKGVFYLSLHTEAKIFLDKTR